MAKLAAKLSQSTIKMEKGYYEGEGGSTKKNNTSQSTIKMEKGYYITWNGSISPTTNASQSTIKMEKGYYLYCYECNYTYCGRNPQ